MEMENVEDGAGNTMRLQKVDGRYYPTFPTDVIKNMTSLKIREDDILLTGYLKSGTHWVWEILRMLVRGSTQVDSQEKDSAMMEQTEQSSIDQLPSRRILNTHVLVDMLPTQVWTSKPKIIYLTRNPKDVAVSMYNHHVGLWDFYRYKGNFDDYLPLFLNGKVDYGSWFSHIKSWTQGMAECEERGVSVMEVNYEDLSQDAVSVVKKMAQFIDVTVDDDLVSAIVQECHISRMRDRKGKFDLDDQGQPIMYRKGQVGGWREVFTDEQIQAFDARYSEEMDSLDTSLHWRFEL